MFSVDLSSMNINLSNLRPKSGNTNINVGNFHRDIDEYNRGNSNI